jgi:hypothetical protein
MNLGNLARIFKNTVNKKGIDITQKQAQQFVSQQATGQIFQGRLPSNGKITASRSDMRFQADFYSISPREPVVDPVRASMP